MQIVHICLFVLPGFACLRTSRTHRYFFLKCLCKLLTQEFTYTFQLTAQSFLNILLGCV